VNKFSNLFKKKNEKDYGKIKYKKENDNKNIKEEKNF